MRRSLVALVLAGLAAACGVPDDREPRVISAADAPLDLDPSDDQGPAEGAAEVRLYFVDDSDELVSIARSTDEESLDLAIDALLAGIQETDVQQAGRELRSQIPEETVRRSTEITDEVAIINLGCAEGAPPERCGLLGFQGNPQALMFGQLTCTADAVPGVAGVRFQHEGAPVSAPLGEGETTDSPVRCLDYQ